MAAIVAEQKALLKRSGFRKRRHSFNRVASDGIVHVVLLWMAPKEPPAWTEVPGLRERRYGSFRVDFGVYVPEMKRMGTPRSEWINEYDCHLRRTMGQLMSPGAGGDVWWQLDRPSVASDTHRLSIEHGLPWLDRFAGRESVLDSFGREGPLSIGMSPAGSLDVADLYRAIGEHAAEETVLRDYVKEPVRANHGPYLHDYLVRTGHADLAKQIQTHE